MTTTKPKPMTIQTELMEYLRDREGVCAEFPDLEWDSIRYQDGDWQAAKWTATSDGRQLQVQTETVSTEMVLSWLRQYPVQIKPAADATHRENVDESIWTVVDDQIV